MRVVIVCVVVVLCLAVAVSARGPKNKTPPGLAKKSENADKREERKENRPSPSGQENKPDKSAKPAKAGKVKTRGKASGRQCTSDDDCSRMQCCVTATDSDTTGVCKRLGGPRAACDPDATLSASLHVEVCPCHKSFKCSSDSQTCTRNVAIKAQGRGPFSGGRGPGGKKSKGRGRGRKL